MQPTMKNKLNADLIASAKPSQIIEYIIQFLGASRVYVMITSKSW